MEMQKHISLRDQLTPSPAECILVAQLSAHASTYLFILPRPQLAINLKKGRGRRGTHVCILLHPWPRYLLFPRLSAVGCARAAINAPERSILCMHMAWRGTNNALGEIRRLRRRHGEGQSQKCSLVCVFVAPSRPLADIALSVRYRRAHHQLMRDQ
jgi:hypothetical protein